ncbi:linker for activation of T-cells family member 2 isoform X1 [Castor canadensis]|nr:linker for activation of T-cells family member 2 isoform X2 [Castor canadensis]
MSGDTELLWLGVALLLLLSGATAGLCVRCSRPGAKRTEKIYEQRNLQENQQSFSVARAYSFVRQEWPGPLLDTASDGAPERKDKLLCSSHLEDPASPRYQNFSKGSRSEPDAAYVDLIAADYYNWGRFQKPLEDDDDDDDANSYENVLICKPRTTESGIEECEDYQNSASIHQWQESMRIMGQVRRTAHLPPAGSPDDDGEPDYVNGDVVTVAEV